MRPDRRETLALLAGAAPAALGAFSAFGTSRATQAQAPAAKPNILFVLMDNLGYGEVGAYGGGVLRGAPTPRIDRLATEGTRLTNFNVEAQCTPSRSAILTGRFAIRSGTHSVPLPGLLDGLTQWEVTLAAERMGRRTDDEDRGGVRTEFEALSTNRARHAGPISTYCDDALTP
jgi:hypothetical protein